MALGLWKYRSMGVGSIPIFPWAKNDHWPSEKCMVIFFTKWIYWEIFHWGGVWYVHYWRIWTLGFSIEVIFRWLFILYATDDNDVVGLIHLTPEGKYTPEYKIPDDYVVYAMLDDMLEAMEHKNVNICFESDSSSGE